jgi:hypothetical protein
VPLDDDFVEIAARVRNWGRWGDDELGLEALAADCAADGRATFLLSATPEPVTGAPVVPKSVK